MGGWNDAKVMYVIGRKDLWTSLPAPCLDWGGLRSNGVGAMRLHGEKIHRLDIKREKAQSSVET